MIEDICSPLFTPTFPKIRGERSLEWESVQTVQSEMKRAFEWAAHITESPLISPLERISWVEQEIRDGFARDSSSTAPTPSPWFTIAGLNKESQQFAIRQSFEALGQA